MVGLIIAAGKQQRFKSDKSKALSIINGETILQHNMDLLEKHGCYPVFAVVSTNNKEQFTGYPVVDIGESGKGSGDAILKALEVIHSNEVVICWGDVYLTDDLVKQLIETKSQSVLVPVNMEDNPYVAFEDGKVLFSKYGENVSKGYHDYGVFKGPTQDILMHCKDFKDKFYINEQYNHKHGNEFEFLDVFNETDLDYSIMEIKEKALSFNTLEELEQIKGEI